MEAVGGDRDNTLVYVRIDLSHREISLQQQCSEMESQELRSSSPHRRDGLQKIRKPGIVWAQNINNIQCDMGA